jgi:hypothetical protein
VCHIHDSGFKEASTPIGLGWKNEPCNQVLEAISFPVVMESCIEVISSAILNLNHSCQNPFPAPIKSVANRLYSRLRRTPVTRNKYFSW